MDFVSCHSPTKSRRVQIRPFRVVVVGAAAKVNLCSRNEQTADDKGVIIDSFENREDWHD